MNTELKEHLELAGVKMDERDQLAREYAESDECEVMDTYSAHADTFKAGWNTCLASLYPKVISMIEELEYEYEFRIDEDLKKLKELKKVFGK